MGVLKIGQFSWTSYVYYPLRENFLPLIYVIYGENKTLFKVPFEFMTTEEVTRPSFLSLFVKTTMFLNLQTS